MTIAFMEEGMLDEDDMTLMTAVLLKALLCVESVDLASCLINVGHLALAGREVR
jgi:hypothetical protein